MGTPVSSWALKGQTQSSWFDFDKNMVFSECYTKLYFVLQDNFKGLSLKNNVISISVLLIFLQ